MLLSGWRGHFEQGVTQAERARFPAAGGESDAAYPSAGATRWVAPSVPEKHRQDRRDLVNKNASYLISKIAGKF